MNLAEERKIELEVLQSIFDGDERFKVIDENKFQYKFGEDGNFKSFLMEVAWPNTYPETVPTVNLDLFYNTHLLMNVKEYIIARVLAEAENCVGMAATFTLIEFVKENYEDLVKDQVEVQIDKGEKTLDRITDDKDDESLHEAAVVSKKSKMTKAQKRRMWEHTTASTLIEKERGWNWVDVVKHLSQTKDSM